MPFGKYILGFSVVCCGVRNLGWFLHWTYVNSNSGHCGSPQNCLCLGNSVLLSIFYIFAGSAHGRYVVVKFCFFVVETSMDSDIPWTSWLCGDQHINLTEFMITDLVSAEKSSSVHLAGVVAREARF